MSDKETHCPIFGIAYLMGKLTGGRQVDTKCIKENCAWWDKQPIAGCAVLSLGEAAKAFAIKQGAYE